MLLIDKSTFHTSLHEIGAVQFGMNNGEKLKFIKFLQSHQNLYKTIADESRSKSIHTKTRRKPLLLIIVKAFLFSRYPYRNASIGSRLEALIAGNTPNSAPIRNENPKEKRITGIENTTAVPVRIAYTSAPDEPIPMPINHPWNLLRRIQSGIERECWNA